MGTPVLLACGDGMTAPMAPPNTVMGSWAYQAFGLTGQFFGEQVTCDYDLQMFLPGSGASFVGIYENARLFCNLTGEPQLVDLGGGDIVGGSLVGDEVRFDMDSETIHNVGTLNGDVMSGQVEIELVVQVNSQIDTVAVVGGWTATR